MKKSVLMFSLLSGTALMFPRLTIASGLPAHTLTYTPEPKPAFQFEQTDKAFKTAAVCFLGAENCGDARFSSLEGDDDYKVDTVQQCKNEGYSVTSCSLPAYPSGQCPYNSAYFAKCVEDRPRACKEAGFTETSCASGTVVEATCSFDANYKKCKCDPCSGYDYTYAQASAQGYVPDGSCLSCSETKYKRKENPCSGYSSCECGAAAGASICYSGSTAKYSACENCDPCPGYYDCGGSWQYCEGSVCSADSSRCSTYCESDHFPYSCGSDYGSCYGDYRNGYCSVECEYLGSSSSGDGNHDGGSSTGNTSCATIIGCSCSELSDGRIKICHNTEYSCTPAGGSTYTVYEDCGSSFTTYGDCSSAIAERPYCSTGGSPSCYVNSNTSYSACGF